MKRRFRKPIRWRRWILGVLLLGIAGFALTISHNSPCPSPMRADGPGTMQAVLYRCYGPSSVLQLETTGRPAIDDHMLLVKVHAASVNPLDWHFMRGEPYIMRMQAGYGRPQDPRIGVDFSGTVQAVGKAVGKFKVGDEVFGGSTGSFAQYIGVREDEAVALKPAAISHEQAAAVPIAATTALQALRDHAQLKPGQNVLVNGASGGVGTYAVQIARAMGAHVTGVCSTRNVSLVASLGADRVLDYTSVDFTAGNAQYDVVLDTVGNRNLRDIEKVLGPGGIAVIIAGSSRDPWIGPLSVPLKISTWGKFADGQFKFFIADLDAKDLAYLAGLMEAGRLKSVIDRTYPLAQTAEAMAYVEEGHARGKVVIEMDTPSVSAAP